nr:immunoglobulin heavy chain junction region [Macaca mulatta]
CARDPNWNDEGSYFDYW